MEIYPSDLADAEWVILEPLIPPEKPGGHPRQVNMRAVLKCMMHLTMIRLMLRRLAGATEGAREKLQRLRAP